MPGRVRWQLQVGPLDCRIAVPSRAVADCPDYMLVVWPDMTYAASGRL